MLRSSRNKCTLSLGGHHLNKTADVNVGEGHKSHIWNRWHRKWAFYVVQFLRYGEIGFRLPFWKRPPTPPRPYI